MVNYGQRTLLNILAGHYGHWKAMSIGGLAGGLEQSAHLIRLCKAQSLVSRHASRAFLPENNQTYCS